VISPEIRLPSITSYWKRQGETDAPEISFDEIERCMERDIGMRSRVANVKEQQHTLESERAELEKAVADLQRGAIALETHRVDLQDSISRFKNENSALHQQLAEIEKKKHPAPRTQREISAVNSLVNAYNREVGRANSRRGILLKEQDDFNQSVGRHNANVAALNQRADNFNELNDEFQNVVASLLTERDGYLANCTGTRLIRK
jgi:septal ring factor EnvC (AmiA/AmiB activator)